MAPEPADDLPLLPALPSTGNPCLENACSACCHDTEMLLTDADAHRMAAAGQTDGWFEAEDGYLQLKLRDAPPVKGHHGKPCWFLDTEGRCTIRDIRPQGCRIYPAVWDGRPTLDAEHCPHTNRFQLPRWAARALRELVDQLEAERDAREAQRLSR